MPTTDRSSMGPPIGQRRARRLSIRGLETWLWTGPIGHLVGGALDFGYALARYLLARVRSRAVR